MIFSVFQKNCFFGYSWSTLLGYRCYYPHRSRDALSPVCGIFSHKYLMFSQTKLPEPHIFYSGMYAVSKTFSISEYIGWSHTCVRAALRLERSCGRESSPSLCCSKPSNIAWIFISLPWNKRQVYLCNSYSGDDRTLLMNIFYVFCSLSLTSAVNKT